MRAAVLTEPRRLELHDLERPSPADDEVLVRVQEVGICGSDIHYFEHGRIGHYVVDEPLVLGHESAGHVVEVGDAVTHLSPEDRVTLEPGIPCRRCEYCRRGRYHLCPHVDFMATPPDDGAFVEYIAWPADFVYPLPESVSIREGALCEPLSVALHANELAALRPGDSVLITGAGPIGLVILEVVLAAGVTDVIVTDVIDSKLDRARKRGAHEVVNVEDEPVAPTIAAATGDRGVDVVIEASGAASTYAQAIAAVEPGGTIVCVGLATEATIPLDMVDITLNEITVQGAIRYSNTYDAAISLLADGRVDVAGLVDAVMPLEEIGAAFERAMEPETVKVMVDI